MLHHASRHWRRRYNDGDIDTQRSFLTISSSGALGMVGANGYGAAKAEGLGLTRIAARELDQYDVRADAMLPAAVTPLVPDELAERMPPETLSPERVAPLPVALMTDAATDITGWTFAIAGETVHSLTTRRSIGLPGSVVDGP